METFAPAYFDYMSSAVSADVRPQFYQSSSFMTILSLAASDPARQGLRLLQAYLEESGQGQECIEEEAVSITFANGWRTM